MSDLTPLLERLEKAAGADMALDGAIYEALIGPVQWHTLGGPRTAHGNPIQDYTADLNAVLALVEEKLTGWSWVLFGPDKNRRNLSGAILGGEGLDAVEEYAPTPALALLKALVTALGAERSEAPGGAQ